ncbi:concanavalin A-like lectin/glucanase domain-containing protein [Lasiosphaeria miniovina]|uniref:Endo-1,4-beta-xylanase n=1 Tax=Lasiosphaeria miniovina TaxID=1954250 RepID=A0AA40B543_9PEZI|nr:concanavalin A-like lectin/glucanase domain-containing protein [Lasiosphaeria miniovina]KAK0727845.1 concanavalin A-like lectin/glucanase domain-containing protein [Lasiosphaeria miniovina]
MLSFAILVLCLWASGLGVVAAPSANYFWSSWSDGKPKLTTKNGADGKFSVKWSGDKGNFVIGKGWSTGGAREVTYSGSFEPVGNGYLSIYGWMTNPLVEYYIIEAYGTHKPSNTSEAKMKGNFTSDGGSYEIMTKQRVNKPSIQGTATFAQYWSIRSENKIGGTVNTGNHFKAWEAAGLKMGKQNYMIVAIEGQDSSGTADITVGVPPAPAATET